MAQVTLLGTGAALSDAQRENTYIVVRGETSAILVDCAGSPTQRLERAGVPLDSIDHLVLTHSHPDHIYGVPLFLMDLWLAGRRKPLHITGLAETLRTARAVLHAFDWESWNERGMYPVEFHRVEPKGIELIIVTPEFSISAATTAHLVPTIGLRFVSSASAKALVYSSDTAVCEAVMALACDADILLHEATTIDLPLPGHSSARQAGEQAARAHANRLVLVHLPPNADEKALYAAAAENFGGTIVAGRDLQKFKF
jgi:ribonuclease Z